MESPGESDIFDQDGVVRMTDCVIWVCSSGQAACHNMVGAVRCCTMKAVLCCMRGALGPCCSDCVEHPWIVVVKVCGCHPLRDCADLVRRCDSSEAVCPFSSCGFGLFACVVGDVLLVVRIGVAVSWGEVAAFPF